MIEPSCPPLGFEPKAIETWGCVLTTRERLTVSVCVGLAFGGAGLWRVGLAIGHYRASLAIVDDPSFRELEQVSAFVELGLGAFLLAHAAAALYLTRRSLQLRVGHVVGVGTVTVVLVGGSLLRLAMFGEPGLLPALLILGCAYMGFFVRAPWASAYVGALLGGVAGVLIGLPSADLFVIMAVVVPPICYALLGIAIGKALGRLRRSDAGSGPPR